MVFFYLLGFSSASVFLLSVGLSHFGSDFRPVDLLESPALEDAGKSFVPFLEQTENGKLFHVKHCGKLSRKEKATCKENLQVAGTKARTLAGNNSGGAILLHWNLLATLKDSISEQVAGQCECIPWRK